MNSVSGTIKDLLDAHLGCQASAGGAGSAAQ